MDLKETGYMRGDWTGLAEDRDQWQIYVNMLINLLVL